MHTKKSSSSNMRFLKGNVIFFALLMFVIILFTYYTITGMDVAPEEHAKCVISFSGSYDGGECEVFIDDSLLYAGAPLASDTSLVMKRYATVNSIVSLYTSESHLKVVVSGDTVVRTLGGDRLFCIGSRDGAVVIDAVE